MNQTTNDPFKEFSIKVRRVLECPNHDVVLHALKDLAEGRMATVLGTAIDALSGLGQQTPGDIPNRDYQETMTTLLTWGMRNFLIEPSDKAMDLWTSMSILDGPRGYAQYRLFTSGPYLEGIRVEPLEGGLLMPSPPKPSIIVKADQHPVKPLDVDPQYVVDYFRQEAGVRAVIATASRFGWEDLCVECICLYVDADNTQGLAESAAAQEKPTIILEGKLRQATENIEAATRLLEPPGLDKLAISARKSKLRRNRVVRAVRKVGPFLHGQSISLMGAETRGSVAVFLSPEDEAEGRTYALTAYHAAPSISVEGKPATVITPGGLDILTRLLEISETDNCTTSHEELGFLLDRWDKGCGEVVYGHIGANREGWRSDWALVRLGDEWKGVNGSWMNRYGLRDAYLEKCLENSSPSKNEVPATFTGMSGIIACTDAMAGTICAKDGATTGYTAGRVGGSEALMFTKGTAEAATGGEIEGVDHARLVALYPTGGEGDVALPGDSGCGVFRPVPEKDGWSWAGQIVSNFNRNDGSVSLMVPQSEIFRSLQHVTHKSWHLSH